MKRIAPGLIFLLPVMLAGFFMYQRWSAQKSTQSWANVNLEMKQMLQEAMPAQPLPKQKEAESNNDKVNLNTAQAPELEALPGLGPSKAKAILDYRKEHGNFQSTEELKNVKGIGDKIYEGLASFITISQP